MCCNSGCNPCILDVHEEQLEGYISTTKNNANEISCQYENCIHPASYSVFKVVGIEKHTQTSYIFTFEYSNLSKENDQIEKRLMYEPGQHFLLKGNSCTGKQFTRAYTPIPYCDNSNSFTILVRLYDEGKMSTYLSDLQIGNETLWRGPYGNFNIDYNKQNILFIAQGTGIAPIFAIIFNMLLNINCETVLHLFFCCRNGHEIFLRTELYKMKAHWNFNYDLFIKDTENIVPKYEEVIHRRKLEKNDITLAVSEKCNLQIVICGSTEFGSCMSEYARNNGIDDHNIYVFS